MWLLVLLTLLNASLPNDIIIEVLRITPGGIPINILDILLILGLVVSIAYPSNLKFPADHLHPLLWPTVGLFIAAILISSIQTYTGQYHVLVGYYMRTVRHYAAFPAALVLGYCLLPTPKAAKFFTYVMILSGFITAILIILFFKGKGEELSGMEIKGVNALRTIAYVTPFASLAVAMLIFSLISRVRLLPLGRAILIAGTCIIGIFVTLTRSEWIAAVFGILAVFFIIPKELRRGLIAKIVVVGVILFGFLWGSIEVTSGIMKNDFAAKMHERVQSMLPWSTDSVGAKAWDTRTPGMVMELEMFSRSPLWGQGFGSQYAELESSSSNVSMRHNAFTSIMAETGLLGLTPMLMSFWIMGVLGRRMVLAQADSGTVLIGALGFISAVFFFVLGMSTMSFNNEREGIVVGMICGMVLRARAMQLTLTRMSHAHHAEPEYFSDEEQTVGNYGY